MISQPEEAERLVKLRQTVEAKEKLGFSLRGGKEATGSSVGVFVSHVERYSEADRKGLKVGDQLIQVNGLSVNRATYDEVICLIKRTPRSSDIILKVSHFGSIPVQEKCGEPIRWLQVGTSKSSSSSLALMDSSFGKPVASEEATLALATTTTNDGLQPAASLTSSSTSSDEGIESCESQGGGQSFRTAGSLSGDSDELQPAARGNYDDFAISSASNEDDDEDNDNDSASSSCALSLSMVSSADTASLELGQSAKTGAARRPEVETVVRVAGGRRTKEPFGCGVVKGPDEWPGIFVQNVRLGSLAQRVGLEPGDQLTRADGQILAELSFEAAIGLVKRLQQEQEELVLHVKKGAALRHLAASRRTAGAATSNCCGRTATAAVSAPQEVAQRPPLALGSQGTGGQVDAGSQAEPRISGRQLGAEAGDARSSGRISLLSASAHQLTRPVSDNPISGTQSQSGGKSNRQQQQSRQSPGAGKEEVGELEEHKSDAVNMEMHRCAGSVKTATGRVVANQRQVMDDDDNDDNDNEQKQQQQRQLGLNESKSQPVGSFRERTTVVQSCSKPTMTNTTRAVSKMEPIRAKKMISCEQQQQMDEQQEEQIRIVSQNCKLHHQSSYHNQLKTSLLLDGKFPQTAARVQQQQQQQPAPPQRKLLATTQRRPLEYSSSSKQHVQLAPQDQTHHLQRYVSVDNLSCIGRAGSEQRPQARAAFGSRKAADDTSVRDQAEVAPRQRRIYWRSSSVLGQPVASCCERQTVIQSGCQTASVKVPAHNHRYLQAAPNLPPPPPQRYSHTLGAPLAFASSKAHSMDKLNINLSYARLNIQNLQHHYPQAQQAAAACNRAYRSPQTITSIGCASSASSRRALLRRLPAADDCCSLKSSCLVSGAQKLQQLQQQPVYAAPSSYLSSAVLFPAHHQAAMVSRRRRLTSCCCADQSGINPSITRRLASCQSREVLAAQQDCCLSAASVGYSTTRCQVDRSASSRQTKELLRQHQQQLAQAYSDQLAPTSCCSGAIRRCCQVAASQHKQQLLCEPRSARNRKHLVNADAHLLLAQCGATTDSSGYLSATERSSSQTRLLRLATSGGQAQETALELNPRTMLQVRGLSTFGVSSSKGALLGGQHSKVGRQKQPLASPLYSTSAYSPSSVCSSTGSLPSEGSSLAAASSSSSLSSSLMPKERLDEPESPALKAPPSGSRPVLLAHHLRSSSPSREMARIPCPPPMPAKEDASTFGPERKCGAKEQQPETEVASKNRLCFVDELKQLAKRQQQQQSASSSPQVLDSSTLIKIINASKPTSNGSRKSTTTTPTGQCGCHNSIAGKCISQTEGKNCAKHQKMTTTVAASNKLAEREDCKRRQHEMLMKEFKSAHSKMFSKRRNLEEKDMDEANSQQQSQLQVTEDSKDMNTTRDNSNCNKNQRPRVNAKQTTAASPKMGLLAQSSVHLAAAN